MQSDMKKTEDLSHYLNCKDTPRNTRLCLIILSESQKNISSFSYTMSRKPKQPRKKYAELHHLPTSNSKPAGGGTAVSPHDNPHYEAEEL